MKLYHGTNSELLHEILKDGLQPRRERKGNWCEHPSRPDYVYLTLAYPLYFALASVFDSSKAKPVVLEIEADYLEESHLCPDEDFIVQTKWKGRLCCEETIDTELHLTSSLIEPLDYRHLWQASLNRLGQVAHWGCIPVKAITRYTIVTPETAPLIVSVATRPKITIHNYAHCARYYRSLVRFLFEGTKIKDVYADAEADYPLEYVIDTLEGQHRLHEQWERGVEVRSFTKDVLNLPAQEKPISSR